MVSWLLLPVVGADAYLSVHPWCSVPVCAGLVKWPLFSWSWHGKKQWTFLIFSIWVLSLVTHGQLHVWRGSWLQVGVCSPPGKRSSECGEKGPSGRPCLWVTGLEMQPRVYPSNNSVTKLFCLLSPQQGLSSPGSPMPTHPALGLCTLWQATAAWGGDPAVQSSWLLQSSYVMGGLGEASLCTRPSAVLSREPDKCEGLHQAGDESDVLVGRAGDQLHASLTLGIFAN